MKSLVAVVLCGPPPPGNQSQQVQGLSAPWPSPRASCRGSRRRRRVGELFLARDKSSAWPPTDPSLSDTVSLVHSEHYISPDLHSHFLTFIHQKKVCPAASDWFTFIRVHVSEWNPLSLCNNILPTALLLSPKQGRSKHVSPHKSQHQDQSASRLRCVKNLQETAQVIQDVKRSSVVLSYFHYCLKNTMWNRFYISNFKLVNATAQFAVLFSSTKSFYSLV